MAKQIKKEVAKKDVKSNVISKKIYTITVIEYENKTCDMFRCNEGFPPIELLGVLSFASDEVRDAIKGKPKPTKIIRQIVERD